MTTNGKHNPSLLTSPAQLMAAVIVRMWPQYEGFSTDSLVRSFKAKWPGRLDYNVIKVEQSGNPDPLGISKHA